MLFPSDPPPPSDADVAALSVGFDAMVRASSQLSISSRGALKRDRDTFFWSLFTDKFGSNPNTPYMWSALPLLGFLLPSPMFSLGPQDAVVMISRYHDNVLLLCCYCVANVLLLCCYCVANVLLMCC